MSQDTPPPSPSHTVERIREIIVGRQLDRLEQRVAILEQSPSAGGVRAEARFDSIEARIEAIQQHFQRLSDSLRFDAEAREIRHQEEARRLAEQFQQAAVSSLSANPAELEAKVGQWLGEWQGASQQLATEREQKLIGQLRDELLRFGKWVTARFEEQKRTQADPAAIDRRFAQISKAARALADAADPGPSPGNLPPLP